MTLSGCSKTQLSYIQKYRDQYMQVITKMFVINDDYSFWSIACSNHVYACLNDYYDNEKQKVPTTSGFTVRAAI